jgi:hypothetical protein
VTRRQLVIGSCVVLLGCGTEAPPPTIVADPQPTTAPIAPPPSVSVAAPASTITEDRATWRDLTDHITAYDDRWSELDGTSTSRDDMLTAEHEIDGRIAAASPRIAAAIRCDWLEARLETRAFRLRTRIDHLLQEIDDRPTQTYDDGTDVVVDTVEAEDEERDALHALDGAVSAMMERGFDEHAPRAAFAREVLGADRPTVHAIAADWDEMRALATDDVACSPTPLPAP